MAAPDLFGACSRAPAIARLGRVARARSAKCRLRSSGPVNWMKIAQTRSNRRLQSQSSQPLTWASIPAAPVQAARFARAAQRAVGRTGSKDVTCIPARPARGRVAALYAIPFTIFILGDAQRACKTPRTRARAPGIVRQTSLGTSINISSLSLIATPPKARCRTDSRRRRQSGLPHISRPPASAAPRSHP